MGIVNRNSKGTSGDQITSGSEIRVSDVNPDMETLFNLVNGNLDDSNIDASAAIQVSKLATINLEDVDHHSATPAEQDSSSPLGDYTTRDLATSALEEIQKLRTAIARLSGVVEFDTTDPITYGKRMSNADGALADLSWIEAGPIGENVIANGQFGIDSDGDDVPDWWTKEGTPTLTGTAFNGPGNSWNIDCVTGAGDGLSYTFDDVRASTKYLIRFSIKMQSAGNVTFATSGADAGTEWEDISEELSIPINGTRHKAYVVISDATATDIEFSWKASTGTPEFFLWDVSCFEIGSAPRPQQNLAGAVGSDTGGIPTSIVDATPVTISNFTVTAAVPAKGYHIKVYAELRIDYVDNGDGWTNGDTCNLKILDNGVQVDQTHVITPDYNVNDVNYYPFTRYITEADKGNHVITVTAECDGTPPYADWTVYGIQLYAELVPAGF